MFGSSNETSRKQINVKTAETSFFELTTDASPYSDRDQIKQKSAGDYRSHHFNQQTVSLCILLSSYPICKTSRSERNGLLKTIRRRDHFD